MQKMAITRKACEGTIGGIYLYEKDSPPLNWSANLKNIRGLDTTEIVWHNKQNTMPMETLLSLSKEVFTFLGIAKENVRVK